jgi:hypothetical protein
MGYKRKQFSNLDEVDAEQARMRAKARQMERHWWDDILNPQQLALGIAGKIISRGLSSRKTSSGRLPAGKLSLAGAGSVAASGAGSSVVGKLVKTAGISFLKWQLFNLGLLVGRKIIRSIREKRQHNKLLHQS